MATVRGAPLRIDAAPEGKQATVRSLMGRFSNPAVRREIAALHRIAAPHGGN